MTAGKVLAESPAGHPRGSWPAEEQAQQFRDQGIPVTVVQDLPRRQVPRRHGRGRRAVTPADYEAMLRKLREKNDRSEHPTR